MTKESSRWSICQYPLIYLEGIPISEKIFRERPKIQHSCKIEDEKTISQIKLQSLYWWEIKIENINYNDLSLTKSRKKLQ